MSEVISSFWITGVFSHHGVILYTMWSGKSLHLLCILPFDQNYVCENYILLYVGVYGGLSESELSVIHKLC